MGRSRRGRSYTQFPWYIIPIIIVMVIVCIVSFINSWTVPIIVSVIISVGLIIFIYIYNTPKSKGIRAEKYIDKVLNRISSENPGTYVIHDVIVKDEYGKTSQIDNIFISKAGVFVIETKNYGGRIYGKEDQKEWTQVLAYGNVKNKMYNPVMQNKTHIHRLANVVGWETRMINCVVFVQKNTQFITSSCVFTPRELKKFIENTIKTSKVIINDTENVFEAINHYKENPIQTTEEHIAEIRENKRNLANGICPRCGGKLIRRHSESGDFLGCSNYPKCKFTKKLNY